MFASTLFADEADVRDFERQVETLMRAGQADEAAAIVVAALGELADAGQTLAQLCIALRVEDIELLGWDRLAEKIARLDKPGLPITAIGIDLSWPGHVGLEPDADGRLEPYLETSFYSDTAFAFSTSSREDLLGGYGTAAAKWTGCFDDIDNLIESRGLGMAYGGVMPLVERLRGMPGDDPGESDTMRLGAIFIAVRLHQAVRRAIAIDGLPRPLAVLVGSNESYPFFAAPVIAVPECEAVGPVRQPTELATSASEFPEGEKTLSGPDLRRRLHGDAAPAVQIVEPPSTARASLLGRLFRRKHAA